MVAVRYTVMRLMIFVGFLAVFALLHVPLIWNIVFAWLFSMVTAYFFLARDRETVARGLERRVETGRERRAAKLAHERTLEDEEDAEIEGRRD